MDLLKNGEKGCPNHQFNNSVLCISSILSSLMGIKITTYEIKRNYIPILLQASTANRIEYHHTND